MTDKPPEKSGLPAVINNIWVPIAGFVGAITLLYEFYKLWQGDQRTILIIVAVMGLAIWIISLIWIGFSTIKTIREVTWPRGTKYVEIVPSYAPNIRRIARFLLVATFLASAVGFAKIQQKRNELAGKVIVAIAILDGPEADYGVRNEIIEQLNTTLEDFDDIKIIAINEMITPAEGTERARQIGKNFQADIVLWGWYRPMENPNFTLHIENLSLPNFVMIKKSTVAKPEATLADLKSFSLQQRLGMETSGLVAFLAGLIQYASRNYDEALSRFNQTLENPEWASVFADNKAQVFFYRGNTFLFLDKYETAIADYNQAIQLNLQFPNLYYNRGIAYLNLDKYVEASDDFTEVINISPLDVGAYRMRGATYFFLDQNENAIADFGQIIQINPRNIDAFYARGLLYNELGKYEQAIADFTQIIKIDPQHGDAYHDRGVAHNGLGKYEQAIADFTQAIQINPQDINAYGLRGYAYNGLGQHEHAIIDFNQVIQMDPQSAQAYNNRGIAYFYLRQYEKAIADYDQAIQIDTEYADAYNNRGLIYASLGQFEQAIASFTQAIEINPRKADPFYNRGHAYSDSGQYEQAIADFTQAIEIDPRRADSYNNRGLAYQKLGRTEEAEADFQKYRELSANPP